MVLFLPYLLSDLLHHALQSGGHSFKNFFLIVQFFVYFIMQTLRRMTFLSAQHKIKKAAAVPLRPFTVLFCQLYKQFMGGKMVLKVIIDVSST